MKNALKDRNANILKEAITHFSTAIKLDQDTSEYENIYELLSQILIEKIDDTDGK